MFIFISKVDTIKAKFAFNLHSTMFIFIYNTRNPFEIADHLFTFHYVYIYMEDIGRYLWYCLIYIPLCLYLY